MSRCLLPLALALLAVAVATPTALAGGPTMALGAAEDVVRAPDLVSAKAEMTLFRLAGFSSIRITSQWLPGQVAPTEPELAIPPAESTDSVE